MAFPEEIKTFMRAQDPTTIEDIQNIETYQEYLKDGNFIAAQSYLSNMANGIAMNLNAGRYNEILETIEEIQAFLSNSDTGYRKYIEDKIDAYSSIGLWKTSVDYNVGNIVGNGVNLFICKVANGPNSRYVEPEVSQGWEEYWDYFVKPMPAIQYPVQAEQPSGQTTGDLWFQIIDQPTE